MKRYALQTDAAGHHYFDTDPHGDYCDYETCRDLQRQLTEMEERAHTAEEIVSAWLLERAQHLEAGVAALRSEIAVKAEEAAAIRLVLTRSVPRMLRTDEDFISHEVGHRQSIKSSVVAVLNQRIAAGLSFSVKYILLHLNELFPHRTWAKHRASVSGVLIELAARGILRLVTRGCGRSLNIYEKCTPPTEAFMTGPVGGAAP